MKALFESEIMKKFEPIFNYLEDGSLFRKPFRWLYLLFALGCLVAPFVIIYKSFDLFSYLEAKYILVLLLILIVQLALFGVSILYWIRKSTQIDSITSQTDDFVAIPVLAHLIKTVGEWFGLFIGVFGFFISIMVWLFMGDEISSLSWSMMSDFPFFSGGVWGLFYPVISGFIIVLMSYATAESIFALASIANNTKK